MRVLLLVLWSAGSRPVAHQLSKICRGSVVGSHLEPGPSHEGHLHEGPLHEVEITRPFFMGVYEVTQDEYKAVMGKNPSWFCATGGGKAKVKGLATGKFPVEQVSHDDALEFCRKLSALPKEKAAGRVYRLPTEAEREYAGRANEVAASLIRDVGFDPVYAGPLRTARYTEPFVMVIARLAYEGEGGPELAYRFIRLAK